MGTGENSDGLVRLVSCSVYSHSHLYIYTIDEDGDGGGPFLAGVGGMS